MKIPSLKESVEKEKRRKGEKEKRSDESSISIKLLSHHYHIHFYYIAFRSSVGRASDCSSECPWFNPMREDPFFGFPIHGICIARPGLPSSDLIGRSRASEGLVICKRLNYNYFDRHRFASHSYTYLVPSPYLLQSRR